MGKIQNGKTRVGLVLDAETVAELTARGGSLHQPLGTFARWIIEDWMRRGCPPVNDADRALQLLKGKTPANAKKAS